MRVLLGDDDPIGHPGILAAVVRAECTLIGHVTTGRELLEAVDRDLPDVVVLDLAIAGDVGYDVLVERLVPPWVTYVVVRGDWPFLPVVDLERTWVLDERDPRHLTEILTMLRQRSELG